MKSLKFSAFRLLLTTIMTPVATVAQFRMERMSRSVVSVRTGSTQVHVGWRLFGNDPAGVGLQFPPLQ
jgi:rhamnogalacturonan endolyase